MNGKKIIYLVIAVGICLLAGYIGSYYTTPEIPTWYDGLQKPDLTPPSWVFGPVWTLLYIFMGLSLYLIIQSGLKNPEVKIALALFIFQLGTEYRMVVLLFRAALDILWLSGNRSALGNSALHHYPGIQDLLWRCIAPHPGSGLDNICRCP